MKQKIKDILIETAGNLGGYSFAKKVTINDTRILMYHRFSKTEEERKTEILVRLKDYADYSIDRIDLILYHKLGKCSAKQRDKSIPETWCTYNHGHP